MVPKDMAKVHDFYATMKSRFTKCLDPTLTCEHDAIKAHSVQNANALSLIGEDNHVYELKMRNTGGEPVCVFQKVGRNNASTFTGYCQQHDTEIFRPIDTKPLATDDLEQLFLIAYRSVTRELHATMEGAMRVQGAYQNLVATGKDSGTEPSPAAVEATQHFLKAWGVWKYRYKYFDKDIFRSRFGNIKHSIFKIENEQPILTASSFFSVDHKPWGKPFAAVIVNVVPTSPTETVVIFSYASEHSGKARKYVAPVILAEGQEQKYELSYLLVNRAENFFVSPRVINHWSDEKRKHIETSFFSTVVAGEVLDRAPELMLFDTADRGE